MLAENHSYKLICVCCSSTFDNQALTFEQKLVDDNSFCPHCFADIMNNPEFATDTRYQEYMGNFLR